MPVSLKRVVTLLRRPGTQLELRRVRVRRATTIALVIEGQRLVVYNYMTAQCLDWSPIRQEILLSLANWTSVEHLLARGRASSGRFRSEVSRLVASGFVVVKGSDEALLDERYERDWEWDIRAGLFHLAIKDPPFMSEDEALVDLESRVASRPAVELYRRNADARHVVTLPKPDQSHGLLATLARRRTRRKFSPEPLASEVLATILYAGLGITGFIVDPVRGLGKVPLKMTPSGGARNPYEAYVYARRVTGANPGLYHYSALEHTLGEVAVGNVPSPSDFVAAQPWADTAAALIILVANFKRTMWKYSHPMAYRAVLIEAGHIAQNMMIAAAVHGLSTVPTAALNDSLFERLLDLDRVTQAVVYVIGVGFVSTDALDYGEYEPPV